MMGMVEKNYIALLSLKIRQAEDVVKARQRARKIAELLAFDDQVQTRIATAVSEIARNAYRYAGAGLVLYGIDDHIIKPCFRIFINDNGPGIDVTKHQHSSKKQYALGISGTQRIVDQFQIDSSTDGTMVMLAFYLPASFAGLSQQHLAQLLTTLAAYQPTNLSEAIEQQNHELLQALNALMKARNDLEQRVNERTEQLMIANKALQQEMHKRQLAQTWMQQHQQTLAEAERISSMGAIASTLAHELNQPLTSIISFTKGCIRRLDAGEYDVHEIINALNVTATQAERAGQIIHRIKDFVRLGKLTYETIAIDQVIEHSLVLLTDKIKKQQIVLTRDINPHLPLVKIDALHIEQVISNLIRNAIDALQDNNHNRQIIISAKQYNEQQILLSIQDNGPGLSVEDSEQLFLPYFTTKQHGMGLGLAISRTIIEAHDSYLKAFNVLPSGACFQFTLTIA
jgi:C4-dicarboxylate-specific signal transduction histidine kinase